MKTKRKDTRFNGVFIDEGNQSRPFRAWIRAGTKLVALGRFADETHAAVAADFGRFLAWGPDPQKGGWFNNGRNRLNHPPNFAPLKTLPFDREIIMGKLLRGGCIDALTMANNLAAYDEVAEKLSNYMSNSVAVG